MTITITHPLVTAFFAEDIRLESNGQTTIVGVFGANLGITTIPAALPKLAIFSRVFFPKDRVPKSANFRLEYPWDEPPAINAAPIEDITKAVEEPFQEENIIGFTMNAVFSPFNIRGTGLLRAFFELDGEKYWAGSLGIKKT